MTHRNFIKLALAGLIIALIVTFLVQPLFGLVAGWLVGSPVAAFFALWAVVMVIIKFDDAVILPIADRLLDRLGMD